MKVVIDTNVFVSSFFGGKQGEIIALWKNNRITICLSKDILDEYIEVMRRLNLDTDLLAELLGLFAKDHNIIFTRDPHPVRIVEDDPDDDKFISCALALEASFIVSGDNHLLKISECRGIRIVKPADFLERVENR